MRLTQYFNIPGYVMPQCILELAIVMLSWPFIFYFFFLFFFFYFFFILFLHVDAEVYYKIYLYCKEKSINRHNKTIVAPV